MTKHLKSHENAHLRWDRNTISKPFKCSFPGCSKSFTAKTSLQNHILTQHASKSFPIMENAHGTGSGNIGSLVCDTLCGDDEHCVALPLPPAPSLVAPTIFPALPAVTNNLSDDTSNLSGPTCLHSGCNQTFSSQAALRQHLYGYSPGLMAEYSFLFNTTLHFADIIATWEQKTEGEKASLKSYTQSVKHIIQQSLCDPNKHAVPVQALSAAGQEAGGGSHDGRSDSMTDRAASSDCSGHGVAPGPGQRGEGPQELQDAGIDYLEPSTTDNSLPAVPVSNEWWESFSETDLTSLLEHPGDTSPDESPKLHSSLLAAHDSISAGWDRHYPDHVAFHHSLRRQWIMGPQGNSRDESLHSASKRPRLCALHTEHAERRDR
jgi:hypothetical protein